MAATQSMPRELDQVTTRYREQLRIMSDLWAQIARLGHCDASVAQTTEETLQRVEESVSTFMESKVKVESLRQTVLELNVMLDVSRQSVEAKCKHLNQEEKQKEEAQNIRFKEFQKIHRLQAEKSELEKEQVPVKRKLSAIVETLDEKNEKIRNLETFHEAVSEHIQLDLQTLREDTEKSREERSVWDRHDLDVVAQLQTLSPYTKQLAELEQEVGELKEAIQNHKTWYEEELQTKLFYSTRSRELKHRLAHFRSLLQRVEKSGPSNEDEQDQEKTLDRLSENILVDGSPGVQAKDVERYLSQQYGVRVMADYTMLRRLKEEIGVQGLAYLVEKIRLQNPHPGSPVPGKAYSDWEEKRMEKALKAIALEYREQEENRHLVRVPGMPSSSSIAEELPSNIRQLDQNRQHQQQQLHQQQQHHQQQQTGPRSTSTPSSDILYQSPSSLSAVSSSTGQTSRSTSVMSTYTPDRQSSASSLRRKPSISRLKKLLKF